MSSDNGNGNLRNGLVLDVVSKLGEVLEKIGGVHADVKELRKENEERKEDQEKFRKEVRSELKKLGKRMDVHEEKHSDPKEQFNVLLLAIQHLAKKKTFWIVLVLLLSGNLIWGVINAIKEIF